MQVNPRSIAVAAFFAVSVFCVGPIAYAQNAAVEAQSTAKIKKGAQKTWRIFTTMDHYFGVEEDSETVGAFYFIGSNRFSWGSLQVFQPVIKYYELNPGQQEVQMADTGLRFFSNPMSFIDNWSFRYTLGATLPISEFSRDQGVVTRPGFTGIFETTAGKAYFSVRPFVVGYINQFTTTTTEEGSGFPRPLRQWMAGGSLLGVYSFTNRLSTAASLRYARIGYEQAIARNEQPTQNNSDFRTHQYTMDLSLNAQIIPRLWSVTSWGSACMSKS
ncbi:MAG: hypothetical protein AAF202_04535 [Pseudomonadota bacterium]